MSDMEKFIPIPKSLFEFQVYDDYVESIFAHLMLRAGLDNCCYTTLFDVARACGLSPDKNFRQRPYFQKIIATLRLLRKNEYICGFFDSSNYPDLVSIESIEEIKSTRAFMIKLSPDISTILDDGFVTVPLSDYNKLIRLSKESDVTFWRLLGVYCSIVSRIYNDHGRITNTSAADEDMEQIKLLLTYHPNFWSGSIKRLAVNIECDVSKNTLYKIIDLFNKNNILHTGSAGKFTDADGNVRNVGTVFVRDSAYWRTELAGAIATAKKRVEKLYG